MSYRSMRDWRGLVVVLPAVAGTTQHGEVVWCGCATLTDWHRVVTRQWVAVVCLVRLSVPTRTHRSVGCCPPSDDCLAGRLPDTVVLRS